MADMMSTLKGFLGDNADEKIKGAMEMLKSSGMLDSGNENLGNQIENSISGGSVKPSNPVGNSSPALTPEGLEMIGRIKGMFDQMTNTNDSRSNLLISLKPFMRQDRQRSIGNFVSRLALVPCVLKTLSDSSKLNNALDATAITGFSSIEYDIKFLYRYCASCF